MSTDAVSTIVVATAHGRWDLSATHELLVGRAEEAHVRVEDPRVSRRHLTIRHTGEGCLVSDLDSSRGTYVDGDRLVGTRALVPPFRLNLGGRDGLSATVGWTPEASPQPERHSRRVGLEPRSLATPGDTVLLGRDPSGAVVVDDLLVSRRHARVTREAEGCFVEDLGSRNGTFIDGDRVIGRAPLPGDSLLTVGRYGFRMRGGMLRPEVDDGHISFAAQDVGYTLPSGKALLKNVSFVLPGSSMLAVVGGSGAGKSTLMEALSGARPVSRGRVLYDGRDLYEHLESLRHRIGVVPQADVVHGQLTARQALEFAAELRFPDDVDSATRATRVSEVMSELGLLEHAGTRVEALSGGQRKRVSVALELLTQPSLILLDEPTSGLDGHLVNEVMLSLRQMADRGHTVVVITHDTDNLDLCDRVLVLATGGRTAYFGPPSGVAAVFGTGDYRAVLKMSTDDPDGTAGRFATSVTHRTHVATPLGRLPADDPARPLVPVRQQSLGRQVATLVRRQLRVMLADRTQATFLAAMPFVLAVLALVVPGDQGLAAPGAREPASSQPTQMLVVLTLGAVFMGVASSIGALVDERAIYRREQAVGLSPTAYLGSKLIVLMSLVSMQCIAMVGLTLLLRPGPDGAVLLGSGALELMLAMAFCGAACVALGLWLSAMVRNSDQIMPLLVVLVMVQLVLSGGLFPVDGRALLEQLAWLAPSRWGYAASAGTVDVTAIVPGAEDGLWQHSVSVWLGCLAATAALATLYAVLAHWRLSRPYPERGR